ncbi:MAG: matrixin family metalloprotease [Myxococcales bacterium]|nr:matrixin family metalloprotease [Myxococcales bacterium]
MLHRTAHFRPAIRKFRVLAPIALACTLLLTSVSAHAFSVTTASKYSKKLKRYTKSKVIYHLHPAGSNDMPGKASLDVLRKGFADWMAIGCGNLKFVEGYHCNLAMKKCLYNSGKTCSKDSDCPAAFNLNVMPIGFKNNGRNELVFTEGSKWTHGSYVLGVTVALHNYNGYIIESDIAFNGLQQQWTTDPNKFGKGWSHLPSVAIHEQGHFFGVMHNLGGWSQSDPPTMAPTVMPYGISATLSTDDAKAICFLNPKGGKYQCKTNADCPYVVHRDSNSNEEYTAKYKCQSGTCVWGQLSSQGAKSLGDSCISQSECKKPMYCQPLSGSQSVCSQECNPQTKNCPSGFTCYGYQGQPTKGACIKAPGSATKKKNGETCSLSTECASLFCIQGSCEQKCTPGNDATCGTGQVCQKVTGGNGVCVKKTGPVLKKEGEECQGPNECATGVCMKDDIQATVGHCRNKCTGPGDCGKGYKCISHGEGYQGCLPGKENLASGALCKFDEQCAGNKCILAGDSGKVCSQSCTVGQPATCPCGMACQNSTQGPTCFPSKPISCLKGGELCTNGGECASTVCANGKCHKACDIVTGQDSCEGDQGCMRLVPGGVKGYCTTRGNVDEGKFCLGDEVCVTLFCDKSVTHNNQTRCGIPCSPTTPSCGAGQKCNPLSATYGACYVSGDAPIVDAGGTDTGGGFVGGANNPPASSGCSASPTRGGAPTPAVLFLIAALGLLVWRKKAAMAV